MEYKRVANGQRIIPSEEEAIKIRYLYIEKDVTVQEIADEFGVLHSQMWSYLTRAGLKKEKRDTEFGVSQIKLKQRRTFKPEMMIVRVNGVPKVMYDYTPLYTDWSDYT